MFNINPNFFSEWLLLSLDFMFIVCDAFFLTSTPFNHGVRCRGAGGGPQILEESFSI